MANKTFLDRDYLLLEQAAIYGDRCPQNSPHGPINQSSLGLLAKEGRIRSEVYGHNYRVVTILTGSHAGKCTARPTNGAKPYRVTDQSGTRTARGFLDYGAANRQAPSLPKLSFLTNANNK